jgi:RNA polymerase sigma factor (sigma-70 family)
VIGKSIVPPFARTEHDLICAAQGGNPEAVSYLLTKYVPLRTLIHWQAYKLDLSGRHHDDLRAAANLAVLEALPKFDALRGVKFTTYAWIYVRSAMLNVLYPSRRSSANKLRFVSLDAQTGGESDDGGRFKRDMLAQDPQHGLDVRLERALDSDRDTAVREFVSSLPEGQRGIVFDIFWRETSHAEIARKRGVSRPAISRALARSYKHGRRDLSAYQDTLAA